RLVELVRSPRRHGLVPRQAIETLRDVECRDAFFRRAVNFNAVAGCEQQRFRAAGVSQKTIGFVRAADTFEQIDACRVMAEPNAKKIHGECICEVKVIPQSNINAALNPMMQSAATRFGANQWKYRPCKMSA